MRISDWSSDVCSSDLLRQLRVRGNPVPVLLLTARDAVDDRVAGLNAGADDYLVKPFALAELQARVMALLRRSKGVVDPAIRDRKRVGEGKGVSGRVDLGGGSVMHKNTT